MVSTTFDDSPQLDIQLPESATQTVLEDQQSLDLWVDKNGGFWIDKEQVSHDDLTLRLEKGVSLNADFSVIIQADESVSHGLVVEILNMAQSAGIVNLSIGGKKESAD